MTAGPVQHISSTANSLVKELRLLAQDGGAHRKQGRVWVEGEHLCAAAAANGLKPEFLVFSESFRPEAIVQPSWSAIKIVVMPDRLFASISALESPAGCAAVLSLPEAPAIEPTVASVILDQLQDAGNVGSILRSAAAFGFMQVIAIRGSAALWSPKVLRAGMGAHFGLRLIESREPGDLEVLGLPILQTSSHHGELLHEARLPQPCAWVFGHEGQGVGDALSALASRSIRIAQPGGEESLNVAAAAAICLHASAAARLRATPGRAG